jgi:rhodanese-related sulfurtransferase
MQRKDVFVLALLLGCASAPADEPGASTPASTTNATTGDEALPAAPTVTGPEARALVAEGAFLLDVSRAERAAESLVEGRTNIPLTELRDRLAEVPRDRVAVVYCLNGRGSPRAGAILQAEGYDVRVLGARANWDAE